jgi:transcription termination/antitermination protein NusG
MSESMEEQNRLEPEDPTGIEAVRPEGPAAESAMSPAESAPSEDELTAPAADWVEAPSVDEPAEAVAVPEGGSAYPLSGEGVYDLGLSEADVGRLAAGVAAEAAAAPPMGGLAGDTAPAAEPSLDIEQAAAEEPDDGRRWYVVHCYSGYENKVRHNLEQRIESMGMKGKIFDVVVPTEEELEVRDGKRRTVERRVFPGYILVQMVMSEESWYVVRNTPGVTGFVGMGNEPTALRPEEVAQIVKRMEAEAPRVKVTFKTGQKVRIIDGPFNDFIGTVDAIDMEKAKVRVMVSFFGRETPVELDFLQVEKA